MELWIWILIGYAVLVLISVLIPLASKDYGFFPTIVVFVVGYIWCLIITPFIWLIATYYYIKNTVPKYKTLTIHTLTEDNKTTLRQLGFQEGHFVSNNNLDYDGFRYNSGEIYVLYNGRIGVKYRYLTSNQQDYLFKIIKELPKGDETKKAEEVKIKPFELKENTHVVFKKSDGEKYLTNKQVEDMGHLLDKIDTGRVKDGKELNAYYVINKDEPYADKIMEVIKNGELSK